MPEFTRRTLLSGTAAAAATSIAGCSSSAGEQTATSSGDKQGPFIDGSASLFATTALGAEVTGPFMFQTNELLFSFQHPSTDNPGEWGRGGIGVVEDYTFDMDGTNGFDELSIPDTKAEQRRARTAAGNFKFLAVEGEKINGGSEVLGVPKTPDGYRVDSFAGSRYSDLGHNPDMNQFVPTNDAGTEGYLFTNFEQSPGDISRIPLSRDSDGWNADMKNAMNLSGLDSMREIGGTRINCGGDLSPWGTPMPAEEEYSHPVTSGTASVSDMVNAGSGVGIRGAGHFFNRPNPTGIQKSIKEQFGKQSWSVQGYWALSGVELLAYQLGANRVDQTDNLSKNTTEPINDSYPNKYRYGYILDIRNPTGQTPTPIKYYVMGRAAWELPEVAADKRTVYSTSDGSSKGGLYKFQAEKPIPEYDDPADIRGTLYAPRRTNVPQNQEQPKNATIELEWVPLGTATNGEVESWIAEYDDVTQVDYLDHADTSWRDDLETALKEADREVAKNGNKDYISDQMIVTWAEQYEQNGPDGVDERLRRVPFLETRAATRELDATVEFRKSEGIDTDGNAQGAQPGDKMYIGLAEVNDTMADESGELRHQQVDGGMVYRTTIEDDYNVRTLEPAVVGPKSSAPASVADHAPMNVDNISVLSDGRVLLCEDADQLGRSYPNDGLWVYDPSSK
ncbi:MAG: alkaline phosphatase PhoX [Halonotius sp.]